MFGRRKPFAIEDPEPDRGEAGIGSACASYPLEINPSAVPSRPMEQYVGNVGANPQLLNPNRDQEYDRTPITFNRFGTRWGDLQLKNGLANRVASGQIQGYRGEGWYDVTVPLLPGQTRLIGTRHPGYYPAKGAAPSQWTQNVETGPGSQPNYPGGPGQLMGTGLINPGSGG